MGHVRVRRDCGVTLIELLVAVMVMLVLGAIVVQVSGSLKSSQQLTTCSSNLRQIGVAASLYAAQNGGMLLSFRSYHDSDDPRATDSKFWWPQVLAPYVDLGEFEHGERGGTLSELSCPTGAEAIGPSGWCTTYAMFEPVPGVRVSEIKDPSNKVYIGDSSWSGRRAGWSGDAEMVAREEGVNDRAIMLRHGGGANFLFHDGHVELIEGEDLPSENGHGGTDHAFRRMFDWRY